MVNSSLIFAIRTCLLIVKEHTYSLHTYNLCVCFRFQLVVPTVKNAIQEKRENATAAAVTAGFSLTRHSSAVVGYAFTV